MIAVFTSLIQSFPQAVVAGLLVASVCALLGVFVILKRVVFIGIALSETAACGVAMAMLMHQPPFVGGVILTLAAVALLAYPFENRRIPRDAVLGVLFVLASSLSVLLVSQSGFGLQEIKALLYGDLILTSHADLCIIGAVFLPALFCFLLFIRPTLYTFLDREAAYVLGVKPVLWEMLFFMVLGVTIAAASKITGTLLVFCYLIVPPTFALLLSRRLWLVMILAVMAAMAATVIGLYASFTADLPTNQTICVAACAILTLALPVGTVRYILRRLHKRQA